MRQPLYQSAKQRQVLLHQYRVAVRLPVTDDGIHRHQQRVADARPVPRV